MSPAPRIGDKVTITDGSSDGHTGSIVAIGLTFVRVKRDADDIEVDVANYRIHVSPSIAAAIADMSESERDLVKQALFAKLPPGLTTPK